MKHLIRMGWVLASVIALSLTSCLRESSEQVGAEGDMQIASLQQQVISVNLSMEKLAGIQTVVEQEVKGGNVALSTLNQSLISLYDELSQHVDYLKGGSSKAEATFATLEAQKKAAEIVAALEANDLCVTATKSLSESVKTWVGASFEVYYEAALLRGQTLVDLNQMRSAVSDQKISLDAMYSDVEAGLREGVEAEEITAVSKDVQKNESAVELLISQVDQAMETLENECDAAISALCGAIENYKMSSLKKAGAQAVAQMRASAGTLADLVARVEACETQVEAIRSKLGELEANVDQLLEMIQSVSFLSDYSSDYAVAYYEMGNTKVSAPGKTYDGKNIRTAAGTFELSFMVRPASAAAAVNAQTASIFGYYADYIQTRAVDPSKFINLQIESASVANADRGIVTLKVSHDLKDDFYYKETGAKCALSIATGKTDITSKFIELVPKDNTTTVYVEGVKINQDDFEIDEGQTKNLTTTVNPSSATNKTIKWTSSNTEVATIDQYSGVMTAVKQGNVTITATTNGIDEWGDNLTASVNVKVNPSIRLGGPLYVEVGKTAELSLDFPPAMNIESKVWMSSDKNLATVDNGIVTGVAHTYNQYTYQYNPITITCIVNGNITLTHEMSVVVPQPRQIKLNNYGDDVKSVSMKLDQTISLAGSILPANVDASLFRMTYESDGGLGWINFDNGEIKAPGSIGGRYVYIKVKDIDKNTYMKTSVERTVIVNVEPYWVESISLPATMNLAPGATATMTPTFTSDVDGKQPTNTSLTWTSSNPSIVSINSTTGEMTAKGEGTVTITATTAEGAASGSAIKTASCVVTVKAPVAEVKVGDYFYSDGTWGSSANPSGKTVIGVIFSNANAVAADPILARDYPKCSNGLVISTVEYANQDFGSVSAYNGHGYYNSLGYDASSIVATDKVNGYGNTLAHRDLNASRSDYCLFFNASNGVVAIHTRSVPVPSATSAWYVPSFKEMQLVNENLSKINNSLSTVGGDPVNSEMYWTSTIKGEWYASGQSYDHFKYTFNMARNGWHTAQATNGIPYPVRVVLAF